MPDRCPARACTPCTRTDCDLRTEYYRPRKTGPPHPLAVVHCRTCGVAFTLYPPGYAPYRRQSVLRLSRDGSPIFREKGRDAERADFDGTLFEAALPEARYRTRYVKVTALSKRDMCKEIAQAVGLAPAGSYPALVRCLQDRFSEITHSEGLRPVLILDEAHDLRPDTLAMLRVLTNFDMDSKLVVSIVLAGQPRLRDMLRRDDLADVAGRLAHYATLRRLSRDEINRYVEHRCTIAGAVNLPFDQDAVDARCEIGRGNLRATDPLARKALEITHGADQDVCGAAHVAQARKRVCP